MCALAIVGILAALALPGLQSWITRQALLASANELEADLQFARAAALARQQVVRLVVQPAGSGNCYVLHTGSAGACRCADAGGGPRCSAEATVLRVNAFDPRRVLALTATREAVVFDPRYGTITPTTTLRLTEPAGTAIHAVMNVMGRVRSCSPGARIPGYPSC